MCIDLKNFILQIILDDTLKKKHSKIELILFFSFKM